MAANRPWERREDSPQDLPSYFNEGAAADTCPECGKPMEGLDGLAHAELHYGERELPVLHNNLLARQRRAHLEGKEIPAR